MITLGLTGSIGMGKSTIAGMFADLGVPVWSADDAVHRLYATSQGAKEKLVRAFGDVLTDNVVDRAKLTEALKVHPAGFETLNAIVHPLVQADRADFLARHAAEPLVVVDIPLLYETGAENQLDKVVVVSAPAQAQRERVLGRPGMTEDKFQAILARQMPDAEKRARADYVIDTGQSLEVCRAEVKRLVDSLQASQSASHN